MNNIAAQLPIAFPGPISAFIVTLAVWLAISIAAYFLLTFALRWLAHQVPGELDNALLSVARKPLLAFCISIGLNNTLHALELPADLDASIQRVITSGIVFIVAWFAWRLAGVLLHHFQGRALLTEERVDDVAVAIARLLTPVVIVFTAGVVLLSLWGIDVGAALAGAGIIGLVIGLALQDTLSNIIAGISILADEPFTPGELVQLPDGRLCRVEHIGLRTTKLYHIADHSMIYMPNKELGNAAVTNIFKPSYDMRTTLEVGVAYASNLPAVTSILQDVLCEHPNVMVSDVKLHAGCIAQAVARKRALLAQPDVSPEMRRNVAASVTKWEAWLPKLAREQTLNEQLVALEERLAQLEGALKIAEAGGFNASEKSAIQQEHLTPIAGVIEGVEKAMEAWAAIDDPWALPEEQAGERARWANANARLTERWQALQKGILNPNIENETHLDQFVAQFCAWVNTRYKLLPEPWKDPHVSIKGFGASSVDLQVIYFLDDVRMEHFMRQRRIAAELMIAVHEAFKAHNVEIPFPQTDLWLRSERVKVDVNGRPRSSSQTNTDERR
jgi:small-conductance mechanosensitive channel